MSSTDTIHALARQWLAIDPDPHTRSVIAGLVADKDWAGLRPLLHPPLTFGTSGIRGVVGPGFAHFNAVLVVLATMGYHKYLCDTLSSDEVAQEGILVAYDGRAHSDTLAERAFRPSRCCGRAGLVLPASTRHPDRIVSDPDSSRSRGDRYHCLA